MRDLKRGGGVEQRGGGVESLGKFTLISTAQLATSFDTSRRVEDPMAKVPVRKGHFNNSLIASPMSCSLLGFVGRLETKISRPKNLN